MTLETGHLRNQGVVLSYCWGVLRWLGPRRAGCKVRVELVAGGDEVSRFLTVGAQKGTPSTARYSTIATASSASTASATSSSSSSTTSSSRRENMRSISGGRGFGQI